MLHKKLEPTNYPTKNCAWDFRNWTTPRPSGIVALWTLQFYLIPLTNFCKYNELFHSVTISYGSARLGNA